jgi:hypothetical protein
VGTWLFSAFGRVLPAEPQRSRAARRYSCDPCCGRRPCPGRCRDASPVQRGSRT